MTTKLKNIAPAFVLIGLLLIIGSSIITFKDYFKEYVEDIIYFRGILLGALLISVGSAVMVRDIYLQSGFIALGSGVISLIFISTVFLIKFMYLLKVLGDISKVSEAMDKIMNMEWYFNITFIVACIVFIILIFLRLWLKVLLKFLGL